MSFNPLLGWWRFGLPALGVFALCAAGAALWWSASGPPVVDGGDPAADPRSRPGRELVVVGEWVTSVPSEKGYMVVVLRGRNGNRVACHFEEVPTSDRGDLEARLLRSGEVAVRGRFDGVEDGQVVLRGCRLLD